MMAKEPDIMDKSPPQDVGGDDSECQHLNLTMRVTTVMERQFTMNDDGKYEFDHENDTTEEPEDNDLDASHIVCDDCGEEIEWRAIRDNII